MILYIAASPSLAGAKPEIGSCQIGVWQLPNQILAAAKPEFGSCQTCIVFPICYI